MNPTRGNSSPARCSTFATTRRGCVQLPCLILKTLVPDKRLAAGPSWRSNEEIGDLPLQILVGRDADCVLDAACLQRLVDLRLRKGGVSAERHALTLGLLALDLRHQQLVPVVGAVHVRSQLRRQAVPVSLNRNSG